jgi:hypothetical protein
MGSDMRMPSPPAGPPRFVAAFHRPEEGWKVAAESTTRGPVDFAVAAMVQTVRSRGEAALVEVWGPGAEGSGWRRLDVITGRGGAAAHPVAPPDEPVRSAREERLRDRRHQVLLAALAGAGLTDLEPADSSAVAQLVDAVDAVDEATVRRIAHWLVAAD